MLQTGKIIGLANHTLLITEQGGIIPIADSAAPIKDEKDDIYGVVMVFVMSLRKGISARDSALKLSRSINRAL